MFAPVVVTLEQACEGLDGDLNRQVDVVTHALVDVFGQAAYFHTGPGLLSAARKRALASLALVRLIGARGEMAQVVLRKIVGGSVQL